jgi:hypothetical protein
MIIFIAWRFMESQGLDDGCEPTSWFKIVVWMQNLKMFVAQIECVGYNWR